MQTCPTSRCTWPSYETLGVCSQCADISGHLQYACLSGSVDWIANLTGGWSAKDAYPNATMCGYFVNSTSATPVLMSGYLMEANGSAGEALVMRTLPLTTLLSKEPLYGNGSINFKHIRNTITDSLIVSSLNGSAATVYQNITPVAQECILSWCVKTLQSSYDHGEYSETITSTQVNITEGPFPWLGHPYMDDMGGGTELAYMSDIEISGVTPDGRTFENYGTDNGTAFAVMQALNDMFPAFVSASNTSSDLIMRYKIWKNGAAFNRYLDYNPWLAPNDVCKHMERLAEAMTNVIRSAPSKTMLRGSAFSKETYIVIHWEWLTFPFAILVLSLLFLVSTILKTSSEEAAGGWKTSAMPGLIYSLPQTVQKELLFPEASTSSEHVKKVRIRLLPNRGWRISGASYISPTLEGRR